MDKSNSLERIIEQMRGEMLGIARQRIGSDMADDCVQDALLMAYDPDSKHYDATRCDKDYLLRLLDIVCERYRARRRRTREVGIEVAEDMAAEPQAVETIEEDCHARLAAADVTPLQRQIWTLRLDGKSVAEIAQAMGVTRQMVYCHMHTSGPNLRLVNVKALGYASSEIMFTACAHQHVYRAPTKTGSALANERQARLR